MTPIVIAIQINTHSLTVAALNSSCEVLEQNTLRLPHGNEPETILKAVIQFVQKFRDEITPQYETMAVGVSIAAQVHPTEGVIRSAPNQLWGGLPLVETLRAELPLPLIVENDTYLMALYESVFGAGREYTNVCYITLGDVLTGAFVRQQRVWQGAHGGAGDIGTLLADWKGEKPVTLAEVATTGGLVRLYQSRARQQSRVTFEEIAAAAQEGDLLALKVLRDTARVMGNVLAPAIGLVDPDVVVLGGRVVEASSVWWDSFISTLETLPLPILREIKFVRAQPIPTAILQGTALLVWASLKA